MTSLRGRMWRTTLTVGITLVALVGTTATVNAAPGIATIGPGPSSNTDGVACIQVALKIPADGQFGEQTYDAVKDFQRQHPPLAVDGAVGRATGDLLLPSAPDGCVSHVPSTYSTQDWVSTPRPGQPTSRADLRAKADSLMNLDYLSFISAKQAPHDSAFNFNWSSDGCSGPGLVAYVRPVYRSLFNKPCQQHDFGYRNYGRHAGGLNLAPDEDTRAWIDGRFAAEMNQLCDRNFDRLPQGVNKVVCKDEATGVYAAVRNKARGSFYDE